MRNRNSKCLLFKWELLVLLYFGCDANALVLHVELHVEGAHEDIAEHPEVVVVSAAVVLELGAALLEAGEAGDADVVEAHNVVRGRQNEIASPNVEGELGQAGHTGAGQRVDALALVRHRQAELGIDATQHRRWRHNQRGAHIDHGLALLAQLIVAQLDAGDRDLPVADLGERHKGQAAAVQRGITRPQQQLAPGWIYLACIVAIQVEREGGLSNQPLRNDVVHGRRDAIDRDLLEAQPEDAIEIGLVEDVRRQRRDLRKRLPLDLQPGQLHGVRGEEALQYGRLIVARGILDLKGAAIGPVAAREGVVVPLQMQAALWRTLDRGYPQVRGGRIEEYLEGLIAADRDVAKVLRIIRIDQGQFHDALISPDSGRH